jgi:hypothetical protein
MTGLIGRSETVSSITLPRPLERMATVCSGSSACRSIISFPKLRREKGASSAGRRYGRTGCGFAGYKLVGHAEQISQHIGVDARKPVAGALSPSGEGVNEASWSFRIRKQELSIFDTAALR